MNVAFVSGTSIVNSDLFSSWESCSLETVYGVIHYKKDGNRVLLNRHGPGRPRPPHTINHRANIRGLSDLGCVDVISLSSVGSLRSELTPGTLVSCADYICLQQGPVTFFDEEMKGAAPGIDNNLVAALAEQLAPEFKIETGKVYVQTRGPRFETKAEIRLLSQWGDVIGMTAAHEADLCREIGLHYNSFAVVDNYANGIMNEEIDFDRFKERVKENQLKVDLLFSRWLEIFR